MMKRYRSVLPSLVLQLPMLLWLLLIHGSSSSSSVAAVTTMYETKTASVIANLNKYSKLYLQFHNCAWSSYISNNGNEDGGVCGAGANDDQFWYLGTTECFRANAAYSLYGVLEGQDETGEGCNKQNFLQSFFTTGGVETLTQALYQAGVTFSTDDGDGEKDYPGGVTSDCEMVGGEDDDDGGADQDDYGNDDVEEANDDGNAQQQYHNAKVNSASTTSYGLACQEKKFAYTTFKGGYCHADSKVAVTDELSTFNDELEAAQCVMIYESYSNNYGDEGAGENDATDEEILNNLLDSSRDCNVRDFPNGECPDPYGLLNARAMQQQRQQQREARVGDPRIETLKKLSTYAMFGLGSILIVVSVFIYHRRSRCARIRAAERKAWYQHKKWGLFSQQNKKRNSRRKNSESCINIAPDSNHQCDRNSCDDECESIAADMAQEEKMKALEQGRSLRSQNSEVSTKSKHKDRTKKKASLGKDDKERGSKKLKDRTSVYNNPFGKIRITFTGTAK